jgi:hypothetical protein
MSFHAHAVFASVTVLQGVSPIGHRTDSPVGRATFTVAMSSLSMFTVAATSPPTSWRSHSAKSPIEVCVWVAGFLCYP